MGAGNRENWQGQGGPLLWKRRIIEEVSAPGGSGCRKDVPWEGASCAKALRPEGMHVEGEACPRSPSRDTAGEEAWPVHRELSPASAICSWDTLCPVALCITSLLPTPNLYATSSGSFLVPSFANVLSPHWVSAGERCSDLPTRLHWAATPHLTPWPGDPRTRDPVPDPNWQDWT